MMTIEEIAKTRWTFGVNVFSSGFTPYRAILDEIEQRLSQIIVSVLFEFNDEETRSTAYNAAVAIMEEFAGRVLDYRVVCDSINNSAETIAKSEFNLDVYLKFHPNQHYIQVNLHAAKTQP
jgi:uncharacterized UPF0160 family protein